MKLYLNVVRRDCKYTPFFDTAKISIKKVYRSLANAL